MLDSELLIELLIGDQVSKNMKLLNTDVFNFFQPTCAPSTKLKAINNNLSE